MVDGVIHVLDDDHCLPTATNVLQDTKAGLRILSSKPCKEAEFWASRSRRPTCAVDGDDLKMTSRNWRGGRGIVSSARLAPESVELGEKRTNPLNQC